MAAENLLQLTFVSRARRLLGPDDLAAIEASSLRNNARLGLTGLMIHRDGRFFAVIEGAERALLRRMEVIITDSRHSELRILSERQVATRRFENWSFAAFPGEHGSLARARAEEALMAMLAGRLPRK